MVATPDWAHPSLSPPPDWAHPLIEPTPHWAHPLTEPAPHWVLPRILYMGSLTEESSKESFTQGPGEGSPSKNPKFQSPSQNLWILLFRVLRNGVIFDWFYEPGYAKNNYPLFLIGFTIRACKTNPVINRFWGPWCNTRLEILWGTHTGNLFREKSYPLFSIGFTHRARQK